MVDYLRSTGAQAAYPGLTWDVGLDPSRDRVVVSIRAPLDLPLTVPGSPTSPTVGASSTAAVTVVPGG